MRGQRNPQSNLTSPPFLWMECCNSLVDIAQRFLDWQPTVMTSFKVAKEQSKWILTMERLQFAPK